MTSFQEVTSRPDLNFPLLPEDNRICFPFSYAGILLRIVVGLGVS